jgi:serine protease Do
MLGGMAPVLFLLFAAVANAAQAGNQPLKPSPLAEFSRSIRALTQRVSPAVVQIVVSGYGLVEAGEGQQVALMALQRSTGSGVIVDPDGYIMTNAHVVRGAVTVRVIFNPADADEVDSKSADRGAPVDASIAGIDRETDLALIKVNRSGLPALPYGDSDGLQQGDIVLAVGSPLGLRNSVSMGVVSAPARQMRESDPMTYIQTDASINPGNSGGALVDAEGRLMGINSFILTQSGGSEGIGFAIPSNMVQSVYQQLRKKGHVHRGEIGAVVQDITPVLAGGLELPRHSGVIVADVERDGPAEAAGLKQGDIVLSLDGHPSDSAREFEMAFYRRQKGDKVTVQVLRRGQELAMNVEVAEQQEDDDFLANMVTPEKNLVARLGILCIEIDRKIAKLMPDLRKEEGLIVAGKSHEGQGRYIDLQQGDVIHAINNLPIASLDTFRTILAGLKQGAPVVLLIERDAVFHYIEFEID